MSLYVYVCLCEREKGIEKKEKIIKKVTHYGRKGFTNKTHSQNNI